MSEVEALAETVSEQAILATFLNRPELLARFRTSLVASDFWDTRHTLLYGLLSDMEDSGTPIAIASVLGKLADGRQLSRFNGGTYIFDLYSFPFTIESLSWTVSRIRGLARQRAQLAVAKRMAQIAESGMDAADMADKLAQANIEMQLLIEEPDNTDRVRGLSTWDEFMGRPVPDNNFVIPNLVDRQEVVLVLAAAGAGKALALDTPIATPVGWTTMGKIRVGHRVFDDAGHPCVVTAKSPEWEHETYRVRFDDRSEIVCNGAHEWSVLDRTQNSHFRTKDWRQDWHLASTLTTDDLIRMGLKDGSGSRRWSVPCAGSLDLPDVDLPVDPYVLGVWLGDGTAREGNITLNDDSKASIPGHLEALGERATRRRSAPCCYNIVGLQARLRDMDLLNNKHIPMIYLRASEKQRLALLQGLMDTDGFLSRGSSVGIDLCDERLGHDVAQLARSFGWKVRTLVGPAAITEPDGSRRVVGTRWRMNWRPDMETFRARPNRERSLHQASRHTHRTIESIEKIPTVQTVCIEVDSPSHLYLAGESLIPTHNSWLSRQIALATASGLHPFRPRVKIPPKRTLLVDLENPESTVQRQTLDVYGQMIYLADGEMTGDRAHIWTYPEGLNVRKAKDAMLLERVIAETWPDLVCVGSLYNVFERGSADWDTSAEEAKAVFNRLRARYGCAFWIEHHMPKAQEGGHKRSPFGSSIWERWPSYGRVLERIGGDFYDLKLTFRGDREAGRDFPAGLRRGQGPYPWMPIWDQEELDLIRENYT